MITLSSSSFLASPIECSQQILLHVPDRCGTFYKTLQHKADMVCIQLHESAAHDLRGLVIPCHPQQLAFGGTGVHKHVHDLVDGILIVRAEPEKQLDLQRLIKIILKLLQNCAFGSTRIAV